MLNSCSLISLQRSRSDLDLVELLREKALKEILPLMEKDERNLKDRVRKATNTLWRPSPAPPFHVEQTKRTKQTNTFALLYILYFTFSVLCSSLFSVLESVGLWVTAQDRISMLEGQATNEKVLSPLPQYQTRQLKTAAESSKIIGIIHVERLPRTLHSSFKFIRQVYHGLPVWMGSLLLWSMTWMHDVACVSRVVLFDGHLGTSPYSPSSHAMGDPGDTNCFRDPPWASDGFPGTLCLPLLSVGICHHSPLVCNLPRF